MEQCFKDCSFLIIILDEDFGGDVDIPEEEQVRLLSEYQKEREEADRRNKLMKDKKVNSEEEETVECSSGVNEDSDVKSATFSSSCVNASVPKSDLTARPGNTRAVDSLARFPEERNENSLHSEFEAGETKIREKNDMVIIGDASSACTTSSSSGDKGNFQNLFKK